MHVDLMRAILLELSDLQRSPPEGFLLPLGDLATRLGQSRADIIEALEQLRALDFIEAPGAWRGAWREDGWIFRKLTPRGAQLRDLIADEREWLKARNAYLPPG